MNQIIKAALLFVMGIIAGVGICRYGQPTAHPVPVTPVAVVATAIDNQWQHRVDSLQTVNNTLEQKVAVSQSAMRKSRSDYAVLQQLVDTLVLHMQSETDTAQRLADCDSLGSMVGSLVAGSLQKDSLCDSVTGFLQQQAMNCQQSLHNAMQAAQQLQGQLQYCQTQQQYLIADYERMSHEVNKRRVHNKILVTGMAVLGGIFTYQLLSH